MTVRTHIVTSALLAAILYSASSSAIMSLTAALGGVFIDLDHMVDYLVFSGEKFSLRGMFSWCDDGRWEQIVLIFHSYELFALYALWVYFNPHPFFAGIFYGVGLHLILDQIGNRYLLKNLSLHPLFYFLTYRAWAGFRKEYLREDRKNFSPNPDIQD